MNYTKSINYLYDLQLHGIKLGLQNPGKILSLLGNPEGSFSSIHIAGTNGKGSTLSMVASVLEEAGLITGTFISPHLVSFTERIQVNGRQISEEDVVRLTELIRKRAEEEPGLKLTFFEFVTAMAFVYFMERGVQWAVVETGMGGRFDATNVLHPAVIVITPIALDHKEFLGETLSEIAYEKAGIIKRGTPLVLAPQHEDALRTVMTAAEESMSAIYMYGRDFAAKIRGSTLTGLTIDYSCADTGEKRKTGEGRMQETIPGLSIPLAGNHQAVNGAVAVKAVEIVLGSLIGLSSERIAQVIRTGIGKNCWPGRCELREFHGIPILLDGAHNPEASLALSDLLQNHLTSSGYRRIILIFGAMSDKNIRDLMMPILPLAEFAIFTSPAYGRAERPESLLKLALETGDKSQQMESDAAKSEVCYTNRQAERLMAVPSVKEAVAKAESIYTDGDLIVVTGSFYIVGEAMEAMGESAVLSRLREFR